jgi:hypothetical protein
VGFKKFKIFAPNPYVLAYVLTVNSQFVAKIDQNSVFLGRDPHILDQLCLMVS